MVERLLAVACANDFVALLFEGVGEQFLDGLLVVYEKDACGLALRRDDGSRWRRTFLRPRRF
jgi:hypothetical protein